jgi:3-oxoacid CoA-transferase subunit A
VEDKYPSLIFSGMYGRYSFFQGNNVYNVYVLGGAYSADKYYRLDMNAMGYKGYRWFPDEQMSKQEMDMAMEGMRHEDEIDVILSHTCPFLYIPRYMFLSGIDQSTVDDTMEHWMDAVENTINYKKWYCGHWHTDRVIDKMRFMFHDIIELSL